MNKYDDIFKWIKNATKQERHIEEMESFAKKYPDIFWKFHTATSGIVDNEVDSSEYIKAKEELTKLFDENESSFNEIFEVIKNRHK